MGFRAYPVKYYKKEFAENGGFYNHKFDGFSELLTKLKVEYYESEFNYLHEISTDGLLKLKNEDLNKLDEEEKEVVKILVNTAKVAEYAKDGFLRVEWF